MSRQPRYADKMTVYEFGRALLDAHDLDPLYAMIWHADLPRAVKSRYVLAYLCFYHTGTAGWITDQRHYWTAMMEAASDRTHPRGNDRRHFRGMNAVNSVNDMISLNMTAGTLLDEWAVYGKPTTIKDTMVGVQAVTGFGPTTSFKAVDMLERLGYASYRFSPEDALLFSNTPQAGAEELAIAEALEGHEGEDVVVWAHNRIISQLGVYTAPPRSERGLSPLETETILCKWMHYLRGSYRVGDGIKACRAGLELYRGLDVTEAMVEGGKKARLWKN